MALARRLSTAELGAKRYDAAQASGLWPIQVRLPSHLDGSTHILLSATHEPTPFIRDIQGGYRASLSVPTGIFKYEIRDSKDKTHLVSMGGLDVTEADAPLTGRGLAKGLTERPESRGCQITPGENGTQRVEFLYHEDTWAAKGVRVEGNGIALELERGMDGAFRGTADVTPGLLTYRFRVTPREATKVEVAPFTRLGWDDTQSGPMSLVTWPLEMEVKVIQVKVEEGEGVVEAPVEAVERRLGGGSIVWGTAVAIAAVACAFGASLTMSGAGREGQGGEGVSNGGVRVAVEAAVRRGAGKGVDAVLRHARGQAF